MGKWTYGDKTLILDFYVVHPEKKSTFFNEAVLKVWFIKMLAGIAYLNICFLEKLFSYDKYVPFPFHGCIYFCPEIYSLKKFLRKDGKGKLTLIPQC